ncbi:glycosyltransferase [Pleomorphovibrio marinus]|uniref:glycosyltransferase n=1 Tax=Pleomorphovibrio marinus TaxID=2164132 RepID=UPI000E0B8954|nr:glycosyltransferase [Pleomorphovibrio marinus]
MIEELYSTYSSRFNIFEVSILEVPDPATSLMICLPCYKEPDLISTLESLANCHPPNGKVELIICINAPEQASPSDLAQNAETLAAIGEWKVHQQPYFLNTHILKFEKLDKKHAGAGWARKIAMDEALARWAVLGKDGPIICLDADCQVSRDYLQAIEEVFQLSWVKLGHLQFSHPFEKEEDIILKKGIIHYELHLRCHIAGLRWAGYPFAVHTLGSCMVVRASHYAKEGGMNRRKAGEDFYFMHKLLPLGGFVEIPATVFPSCRISDRVPFGTGRAQLEWLKEEKGVKRTYAIECYATLQTLFSLVNNSFMEEVDFSRSGFGDFLLLEDLQSQFRTFKSQSHSEDVYFRKVWQWLDGFKVLKLTHYLRDHRHPNQPVYEVAKSLLELKAFPSDEKKRVMELVKNLGVKV